MPKVSKITSPVALGDVHVYQAVAPRGAALHVSGSPDSAVAPVVSAVATMLDTAGGVIVIALAKLLFPGTANASRGDAPRMSRTASVPAKARTPPARRISVILPGTEVTLEPFRSHLVLSTGSANVETFALISR